MSVSREDSAPRRSGRSRGAVLLGMLRRDRRRIYRPGRPSRSGPAAVRREPEGSGKKKGFWGFFGKKKKPRPWYEGTDWDKGSAQAGSQDDADLSRDGAADDESSDELLEREQERRERMLSDIYWVFGLVFFLAVVTGFGVLIWECKAFLYDSDDVPAGTA